MIAALGLWVAKSALMQSPIGGLLKMVPARVWKLLAIAAAIGLLIFLALRWHGGRVEQLKTTSFNAGYAKRVAEDTAEATARAARDVAITAPIRRKTDETIRNNARLADAVRLRGPGAAAACIDAVPAGTGGRQPGAGQADAAGAGLPDAQRIAVPFPWLVDSAERCDGNLAEVLAWREWHQRLTADRAKGAIEADAAPGR